MDRNGYLYKLGITLANTKEKRTYLHSDRDKNSPAPKRAYKTGSSIWNLHMRPAPMPILHHHSPDPQPGTLLC